MARSASVKWELKSLPNFEASNSKQSWESLKSSPFRVIQGVLPLGPIGSLKSFWILHRLDNWMAIFMVWKNYVPRKVCWPNVSRFLILKGTVRCWAWRRPYPVDEAARHLYRPKHSASSYSRPYVLCCSSSIFIELRDTINWSLWFEQWIFCF